MDKESFLVAPIRTAHGRYGGSLRDVRLVELGSLIGKEILGRAGLPADAVDEVIVSNCRQAGNGPNPGRQIAIRAGIPREVPAQTINMACASGLKSIQLAHQAVRLGDADVVLVIAAESMSTMPFIGSHSLRWSGLRRGDIVFNDGWKDGGTDPISGLNMGQTAENVSRRFSISREDQDAWALRSHQRVTDAWESGRFSEEVIPVPSDGGGILDQDETHRPDTNAERLAKLVPVFEKEGTVTAGNASQMADGAAALVVASGEAVSRYGLSPAGQLRSFAAVGVDPAYMGVGPVYAIPKALDLAGLHLKDIGVFEINEAFGAQIVHNVRALDLAPERVNVQGGGIALGHPTGQSGCRIMVTLLHELAAQDQQFGVASLCVGGGQGVAAVIERAER